VSDAERAVPADDPALVLAGLLEGLDAREPWRLRAACRGGDVEDFFPARGDPRRLARAREACLGCPVRHECLAAARARGDGGVRGGTMLEGVPRIR
jgi:hypothetical protein